MTMETRPARRLRGNGGEQGSASIELVILFPALLLLITALVQYGLWFHARSVALAAAQEGVAAARAYGANPATGQDVALQFVAEHASDSLLDATATSSAPGGQHLEVVVTGQAPSVLPGLRGFTVQQAASAPVERFTTRDAP